MTWRTQLSSEEETRSWSARLGALAEPGMIITLSGELGAGKTRFAQGFALGAGVREWVTSPTFALLQEYLDGRLPFFHGDLYRISGEDELYDLGLEEAWAAGAILLEWGERFPAFLPEDRLRVELMIRGEEQRAARVEASGPRSQRWLEGWRAD